MDEPIQTPCTKACQLDPDGICVGCGRTIDEIVRWIEMTPEERKEIMMRLEGGG